MGLAKDLVYWKKVLMSTQTHYQNPHSEAMKMKMLWTHDKASNRENGKKMATKYLEEAVKFVENPDEPPEHVLAVIKKGLFMNPHSHQLYALRGKIYAEKRDWQWAIKWYETARKMLKFDKTCNDETIAKYRETLRNVYYRRGEWYEKKEELIEAIADYEEVLVLQPHRSQIYEIQDKLLSCLRKLDKYEAYRLAWLEFIKAAKPQRAADLMTQHAEYKIHSREIAAARRMLHDAVSLDKNNTHAQDLLQVIFDTGHAMLAYAVVWCITGCYDKALMNIDKGTDCDPYNPGFTVLKTIVLRLSGRLEEAMNWLENVNKSFYRLLKPLNDKRGSIMGNLTIEQTRAMLINQWYLIRYDMAVEHMINGKYGAALEVLQNEKLLQKFGEPWWLMGDCFFQQGKIDQALKAYLKAHEQSVSKGCWHKSPEKKNLIAQRITEILNSKSRLAIQTKETRKALDRAEAALKILSEEKISKTRLGHQRSEALMYAARSFYQASPTRPTRPCLRALADSLSFGRGADDGGIRNAVLGENADFEKAIDYFASNNTFPYCTKILMQN